MSVTITTYLMSLSIRHPGVPPGDVRAGAVPVLMSSLAFFLLYRIIPHGHVPWRHAALGGLVAAILFEAAKELFAIYVRYAPTYNVVYGAFAAVPLFLIWIYVSWLVILFGAELTASASYWKNARWKEPATPAVRLREAIAVTQALLEAGADAAPFDRVRDRTGLPAEELEETLLQLSEAGVIKRSGRSSYALTPATRQVLATKAPAEKAPDSSRKRGRARRGRSSR